MPDELTVKGMMPYLSRDISKIIFIHETLESTNITAAELARTEAEHGTVIIANHQTGGKGRFGRAFYSPPDYGLYMSLILHPAKIGLSIPSLITAYAAVAVCEAIENISTKSPQIKWVNDIFLDDKKICGILTESVKTFPDKALQHVVVGIGVNFSTPDFDFPIELRQSAGALFDSDSLSKQHSVTRNRLAAEIINRIVFSENCRNQEQMLEKYRQRIFLLGKKVTVTEIEGSSFEGTAIDVDDIGRLIVKRANGELVPLFAGEVSVKF